MANVLRGSATGSFFSHHDARYLYAADLSGGTLVDPDGDPSEFARRSLAASGTDGVSGAFAIDANWRAVALRWAWCTETSGTAGNVVFRVRYGLIYPLLGNNAQSVSLTTIAVPAAAANATAGVSQYSLPDSTAAIETPVDVFLGTSPIMTFSIDRLGDDGSDTFGQPISVYAATITRVD